MAPISERVAAEGRSLLRIIAALNAVHEHDTFDQVRKRVQAIVDRNQEISDKRRQEQE